MKKRIIELIYIVKFLQEYRSTVNGIYFWKRHILQKMITELLEEHLEGLYKMEEEMRDFEIKMGKKITEMVEPQSELPKHKKYVGNPQGLRDVLTKLLDTFE